MFRVEFRVAERRPSKWPRPRPTRLVRTLEALGLMTDVRCTLVRCTCSRGAD